MRRQTALKSVTPDRRVARTVVPDTGTSKTHEKDMTTTRGNGEASIFSPLREMERLFEESFNRPLFGFGLAPWRNLLHDRGLLREMTPLVDMFEEGNELVVKAELPGIRKEDLNLRIVDTTLMLSGEKKTEERVEESNYLRLERSHGTFSRSLSLPEGLDTEHITATFRDGVLEVRIPRTESASVRQITVE